MAVGRPFLIAVARPLFLSMGEIMASDIPAFDIEAHRGGRALFPENTLHSFANALSMGVNTLELDIGVTRDGVIIISHERELNPELARNADGLYARHPERRSFNCDSRKSGNMTSVRSGWVAPMRRNFQISTPRRERRSRR
jgi:glycerophosphoryl diester phosphodiesterase